MKEKVFYLFLLAGRFGGCPPTYRIGLAKALFLRMTTRRSCWLGYLEVWRCGGVDDNFGPSTFGIERNTL
jgi:hypothetical protein